MPQIIPSPDEITRMTPKQRERARRVIWAILAETDKHIDRESQRRDNAKAFGEAVRERARDLERYIPKDPPWITAARRQALLEATS
jgi:ApbE superfamily uncharacterized protein (UPF0280 family)